MNRLYFCALYKYLCEKRYNASYVHDYPDHYWDPYTLIRFRRLDPKPADPDNPDIQILFVYISYNQGLCIIDPKAMEMLMLNERIYHLSYADPDWVEQCMGFKKSEMLKELDKDQPFHTYFDIRSNIEFELGRGDYNCSREEQKDKLITSYVKDIEKDMDIWPPYLIGEMMDDSGERMKKEAMLNGRYLFSLGLIQILSVMAAELDKRYIPTSIGPTTGIKSFFNTFTKDEFEVYWGRIWACSGTYNPASMWLTCFDNGLIRIDMPHTNHQTDILQLDPRTFVRLPYPEIYAEECKYLPTERWYDVLKLKINEYLMMANINNHYNRKDENDEQTQKR